MEGIAARAACHVHQLVNAEVAFTRRGGADGISLVGKPDVQRFAVSFAEYADGLHAQFAARAENAHGDFAAIGNQDFLEHRNVERGKSLAGEKGALLSICIFVPRSGYLSSFWRSLHLTSTMWLSSSTFLNSGLVTTL